MSVFLKNDNECLKPLLPLGFRAFIPNYTIKIGYLILSLYIFSLLFFYLLLLLILYCNKEYRE